MFSSRTVQGALSHVWPDCFFFLSKWVGRKKASFNPTIFLARDFLTNVEVQIKETWYISNHSHNSYCHVLCYANYQCSQVVLSFKGLFQGLRTTITSTGELFVSHVHMINICLGTRVSAVGKKIQWMNLAWSVFSLYWVKRIQCDAAHSS